MGFFQQFIIFLFALLLVLLILLLYTQLMVGKKQIAVTNRDGERIELNVEIADDAVKRARGLMFRESLGENEGMLFVFGSPGRHGFWMVNTTIPLDAIFFDEEGFVVDIISMEPCGMINCPVYRPEREAIYVLEVNRGFSVSNKIEKGKSRLILDWKQ